ncbi:MAG: lipase secretion chaperone [Gammaproteobacteria bacterium]|nr:lipase secretion chaperone [Gammaproteobacteria bacterium]
MHGTAKRNALIAGFVVLFILVIYGLWQLKPKSGSEPSNESTAPLVNSVQASPASDGTQAVSAQKMVPGPMPTLAPSLRGTEIDCPLQVDQKGKLVLTIGIRNCFDYFLSSLGEKTESQLITDIRQYLTTTLPSTALPYALKLLDQYIAYRHAQTELQPTAQVKTQTPDSLQAIVTAQKSLRLKFFTPAEVDALFGNEAAYDQYNIDVMKINADNSLTAEQKAAKIAGLMNQLPPSLADSMRPMMQYAELQKLTKEIQARGGSAEELHQMRESLVGPAAAGRLDQLDVDNANWQKQLNGYLAARAQIKAGSGDAASQQQAITTLRNQTFSSPEDRIRAQTYETMRDQGDKRVF